MNKFIFPVFSFLLIAFLACKKNPIEPPTDPGPNNPPTQRVIRLTLKNLPDQPAVINDLTAVVTIKNSRNEVVRSNKSLTVHHDQMYFTDTIKLTKGNYSVTGLIVRQGNAAVKFASPITGSAKAAQVTKPLSVVLVLDDNAEQRFDIELLPVSPIDTPESFGYPAGSFGDIQADPEPAADKRIFVRPLIKIGDIIYDSIPVSLVLRTWDAQNNPTYKLYTLPPGLQPVLLPANAVKYQLSILKWGTYDEITLSKDQVQENTVYILGGNKEAKKLKLLYEYKLVNGVSTPQSKYEYHYQANGELKEMLLWGKREDKTTYLVRKDLFEYQNSKITAIRGYDENAALFTTSIFSYNAQGRIIGVEKSEGGHKTTGVVSYMPHVESTGISQSYQIDLEYTYTDRYYTTNATRNIYGGNILSDNITTTHGDSEFGLYDYDFSINPFAHLAIPDLMMNQLSKHNIKAQTKTFVTVTPEYEPVEFSYTYDADGYPTQLLTKYRSYQTKVYAFTIRTVFGY